MRGLPPPNPVSCRGDVQPETGLIVRHDAESGAWQDALGRDWSEGVRFGLPDLDVFAGKQWMLENYDNIDPERVGIMGSSAGGHLSATLMTRFDAGKTDSADPVDLAHATRW